MPLPFRSLMRFGRDSFLRSPANILFTEVSQVVYVRSEGSKLLAQSNGYKQHALKGQKLLAQGSALGIMAIGKAPCKGKSLKNCLEF